MNHSSLITDASSGVIPLTPPSLNNPLRCFRVKILKVRGLVSGSWISELRRC